MFGFGNKNSHRLKKCTLITHTKLLFAKCTLQFEKTPYHAVETRLCFLITNEKKKYITQKGHIPSVERNNEL